MFPKSVLSFSLIPLQLGLFVGGLNYPSFESGWVTLTAQSSSGSEATIPHDLGEYPVKVDVQVRITDNGENYIFTGTGSAHRDNDDDSFYGGVVYTYNDVDVVVQVPYGSGYSYTTKGKVVYTGGSSTTGSSLISGSYTTADVRVRAWKLCDVGNPVFIHQWLQIEDGSTFHEIDHNLGVYPDLVTVQIELESSTYWSDAQGGTGIAMTQFSSWFSYGGVIFAYDTQKIRLWAPDPAAVFSNTDGWGNGNSVISSGLARIICWTFPSSEILFQNTQLMGIGMTTAYEVPFPQTIDIDRMLVSVEVTALDGNNAGFRFYGIGSSQTDGSLGPFGGVVYGYTDTQVLLWRPSDSSGGKMVYLATAWSSGSHSQASDTANVTIRVMTASGSVNGACGYGTCTQDLNTVSTVCDCSWTTYTGSDCKTAATTTTTSTSTTTTTPTTTTSTTTTTPTTTTSTTTTTPTTTTSTTTTTPTSTTSTTTTTPTTTTSTTTTTPTSTTSTTTTTPTTTTSTTTTTPTTTTTTPTTTTTEATTSETGMPCGVPGTVTNANHLYNGTSEGSTLLYSCSIGYFATTGDLQQTCTSGVWTGSAPVCQVCTSSYVAPTIAPEELDDKLAELKKNTEVSAKNTSSYRRSLVCASDPRPSAFYLGTIGIIMLSLVGIFPFLTDAVNLYEHFKGNDGQY